MLADLIAATATPAPLPANAHDAYDWWSDIWLPALVGVGSIAAAGVAIMVAARSNRLARAATKAAERSNAIARRALEHEQRQAKEAEARLERDRRAAFSDRVLARFDTFVDQLERRDPEARRSLADIGALNMEVVENGWPELQLNDWAGWVLDIEPTEGRDRGIKIRRLRHALHAVMSAWVREPAAVGTAAEHFEKWVKSD